MPPSTATQVETLRLTVWISYSVTVELATSARPGSIRIRLPAPSSARHRAGERRDVVGDRGRLLLGLVGDPEAAAEVVDVEVAERGHGGDRAAERLEARAAGSRCGSAGRRVADALSPLARAIAAGASPMPKPNFESACPVEIASWVSPRTSGVTRSSTSWRVAELSRHGLGARRGRRGSRARCGRPRTPSRSAARSAIWRCRGGRSARGRSLPRARARAHRRRRRHRTAPPRRAAGRRRCREGLGGEQDVAVPVLGRQPADEGAGTGAEVVRGDDEGRGAVLGRQLERVTAADLQVAGGVDRAAQRIGV